jgi:hypothetical protein
MNFIESFSSLVEKLIKFVPQLLIADQSVRDTIIEVISDLASNLTRGITLFAIRVDSIPSYLDTPHEAFRFINETHSRLFDDFSEFNICKELRKIRDKMHRSLPIIKMHLNVANLDEVTDLIDQLENHEKIIYELVSDDLEKIKKAFVSNDFVSVKIECHDAYMKCQKTVEEIRKTASLLVNKL